MTTATLLIIALALFFLITANKRKNDTVSTPTNTENELFKYTKDISIENSMNIYTK